MPPELVVAAGASPVLHEELRKVESGGLEVLGVQGAKDRVVLDTLVEALDEGVEVVVAPHPLVERCPRQSCIVRDHVKQIIATGHGGSP